MCLSRTCFAAVDPKSKSVGKSVPTTAATVIAPPSIPSTLMACNEFTTLLQTVRCYVEAAELASAAQVRNMIHTAHNFSYYPVYDISLSLFNQAHTYVGNVARLLYASCVRAYHTPPLVASQRSDPVDDLCSTTACAPVALNALNLVGCGAWFARMAELLVTALRSGRDAGMGLQPIDHSAVAVNEVLTEYYILQHVNTCGCGWN